MSILQIGNIFYEIKRECTKYLVSSCLPLNPAKVFLVSNVSLNFFRNPYLEYKQSFNWNTTEFEL